MIQTYSAWGVPSMYSNTPIDPKKLILNQTRLTVQLNDVVHITSILDEELTFISSDSSIVRLDESGNLIAVGPGTAVITVKSGDKTGTCKVIVSGLDKSNAYYGTISGIHSLEDLTPLKIQSNQLDYCNLKDLDKLRKIEERVQVEEGDFVIVLLPTTRFTASKLNNEVPFDETPVGVNGIKIGDFYVYGELCLVSGHMLINIEKA